MAVLLQLTAEMMRADAGFHTDQARWHVGKARFHLRQMWSRGHISNENHNCNASGVRNFLHLLLHSKYLTKSI